MISCASLTKSGGRKINEDSLSLRQGEGRLFCVLADGLGGHGGGEVASALAVEASLKVFDQGKLPFGERLAACITTAQTALLEEQRRTGHSEDLKTTITLLQIEGERAQWAHVGDSRVYRFSGHRLEGRTMDHSVPQMLVNQGEIRERDIRFHEDRNRLIRVLGMEWDAPRYELSEAVALTPPTTFLLCSDGFWELVDEKEMTRQLKKAKSPEGWLEALEQTVVKNGAGKNMDNYSAIAVFVR